MKIIKLPAILPGDLDLAKINQQLLDRTAQLDWSAVVSASDSHLALLLAGLDLSDDADVLGDSTLSDTIGEKIVKVLSEQPESAKPTIPTSTVPKVSPTVWQQPSSLAQILHHS
ncbi:helicase domain protein [Leptolyngbya sp. NIES-3755]|nr:helicase domain protein [Leptolyngbya sp. NIES-3755]